MNVARLVIIQALIFAFIATLDVQSASSVNCAAARVARLGGHTASLQVK